MATAVGVAGLLAGAAWKISRTPEWCVLTGTEKARQEICRSVYRKSRPRAEWCFARLLEDPSPGVQVTAIGALVYRADLHPRFAPVVSALADSPTPAVRARALEFLFQHGGMDRREWSRRSRAELADHGFRERFPFVLSFYLGAELHAGDPDAVEWALTLLKSGGTQDLAVFEPLLQHADLLSPHRERLVALLGRGETARDTFVLAALTAVDGQMRGTRPEDWRMRLAPIREAAVDSAALERFTVEAEWAHRLQPNFEVERQQGELCLLLGEGAGGEHFWRQHAHTSVDIGRAFFTFHLAREARYQIWIRCWFSDKCGNHSLLHIDDRWLQWRQAGEDDRSDLLQTWHWKRLETHLPLGAGRHTLTLTAADDGLLYDKLAVLPVADRFDPRDPPPLACLYDPALPVFVSITPQSQAQCRGTAQTLTAWVRRNGPDIREGAVELSIPSPFEIEGETWRPVRFAPGSALAGASFRVLLPTAAVGGEVEVKARFETNGREAAVGSMVLGIHPDWYTTGPLDPGGTRCQALLTRTTLPAAELAEGWSRYPGKGYDRYRRLVFEEAYGNMQHKTIFLYTEIEVAEDGQYQSFLTIDDSGFLFIDGQRVCGRGEPGVGEGWMLVDTVTLRKGRHSVFGWVYQADFPDPEGPDSGRQTPNHWNLKWLLRDDRHRPSPAIRSVPVAPPP